MAEVVDSADLQWVTGQKGLVRGKGSEQKHLFKGDVSGLDNYEFMLSRSVSDSRFSPRHRHTFDQFRFALRGPCNHSPDEDVPEGQLGFFPEGAYYGPQSIRNGSEFISIQLGGASGLGFMSYADWRRGYEELSKTGAFEKGVYTYVDADGKKHNKDAWLAVAEHISDSPVSFPKPRMDKPVVMDPEAYAWVSDPDQPGVAVKHLGTFNERGTFSAVVRVAPGSSYRFDPERRTRLLYSLVGRGTLGAKPLVGGCAARIAKDETANVLRAETELKVLVFGLPQFD